MKKRILFVDDEPRILEGLQRSLRSMRQEWDMQFAESGPEALDCFSKQSFDLTKLGMTNRLDAWQETCRRAMQEQDINE